MKDPSDFPLGDRSKDYCVHCAHPDGTMQTYEEKLESLSNFIVKTQGLDRKVAIDAARNMMANLPAWKNKS